MGNAVCPMGPAHGGEWEDLSCNVPQALHLVLGQSFLESELSRNKTKCHSPPIFLRKSSFVVVLNNSIQKFLSFFPLLLSNWTGKFLSTGSASGPEALKGSKDNPFLLTTHIWSICMDPNQAFFSRSSKAEISFSCATRSFWSHKEPCKPWQN